MNSDPTGTDCICLHQRVNGNHVCHADPEDTSRIVLRSKKGPRKDPRKGSDKRRPSGSRERNVGHPNGEEHSRVPKGNGLRRVAAGLTIAGVIIVGVVLVADDLTGVGTADDAILPVLGKILWDACGVLA